MDVCSSQRVAVDQAGLIETICCRALAVERLAKVQKGLKGMAQRKPPEHPLRGGATISRQFFPRETGGPFSACACSE